MRPEGSTGALVDAGWAKARLSARDYKRLGTYIESSTGIRMPANRLPMLEGRLRLRLRVLGMNDFSEYCEKALNNGANAAELAHLVDRASTNTTEFFRERIHYDFLAREAVPTLRRECGRDELALWSAGCSTGEEAYTLGIVLSEAATQEQGLRHRILATDISQDVLRQARHAVYPCDRVQGIPAELRRRYLLSSRNRTPATCRIAPALRRQVTFRYLNLTDSDYGLGQTFDVIFCRNVFIYFERRTQHEILLRFVRHLNPGGYLFLGHTDTIQGLDVPLDRVAPAVYRRPVELAKGRS